MNETILVIDDDTGLLRLLQLGLEREGFSVITAPGGKEGLRQAYKSRPDLVILDVMMPDIDGWTTCQRLREMSDTPIIMLTAKGGEQDVLRGLVLGADDYVAKPCSFDELKARVHALLRRAQTPANPAWRSAYDDGKLVVDLSNGTVSLNDSPVHLTPTESRLLMCLMSQAGQVIPHQELLTRVWGPEYSDEVGYLSVYVHYLREKIEEDPANPQYVRTRWGMGYYFAGD
ncbi:MAG: response regulator transcription factor [Chloroflexota bacterium]|nr:response regulator transcription factor [Chloroflexota bacterium]